MRMIRSLLPTLALVAVLAPAAAQADLFRLEARLDAAQEVSPPGSTSGAVGISQLSYDSQTYDLVGEIAVLGIALADLNPVAASSPLHIHVGDVGANGSIIVALGDVGDWEDAPETPGIRLSFALNVGDPGVLDPTDAFDPQCATTIDCIDFFEDALLSGGSYLNLHTDDFPAGEIRGQIANVGQTVALEAFLAASQEVAPPGSTSLAAGVAQLSYDTQTYDLVGEVAVLGIALADLNPVAASSPLHIHVGDVGVNGGIIVALGGVGDWEDLPETMGIGLTFALNVGDPGVLDPTGAFGPQCATTLDCIDFFENALLSGGTYLNLHTDDFPTGEIRGQLVPEPNASIAGLAALCALAALRRGRVPAGG